MENTWYSLKSGALWRGKKCVWEVFLWALGISSFWQAWPSGSQRGEGCGGGFPDPPLTWAVSPGTGFGQRALHPRPSGQKPGHLGTAAALGPRHQPGCRCPNTKPNIFGFLPPDMFPLGPLTSGTSPPGKGGLLPFPAPKASRTRVHPGGTTSGGWGTVMLFWDVDYQINLFSLCMARVNCASVRILFQGIILKITIFLTEGNMSNNWCGNINAICVCYQFREAEDILP